MAFVGSRIQRADFYLNLERSLGTSPSISARPDLIRHNADFHQLLRASHLGALEHAAGRGIKWLNQGRG